MMATTSAPLTSPAISTSNIASLSHSQEIKDLTMNTATITPATARQTTHIEIPRATTTEVSRVRMVNVIRGEWIKFWSVRATSVTLIAAGIATVLFGLFFSVAAEASTQARGPSASLTDPVDIALGGLILVEIVVGSLGVIFVTSDYSTGLIRNTFAAVGRRSRVVWAKVAVLSASVFLMGAAAIPAAIVAGQAVYAGTEATVPATEVVDVMLGAGVYLTGIALIGAALAFVLRSTAGSIGTLVGGVFVGPNLLPLLPDSITDIFLKYLPSEAGSAMMTHVSDPDALSRGAAYAVFATWVIAVLAAATFLVQKRDA